MCCRWNVNHTTTSPWCPQSSGLVERQVRTVKGILRKCKKTGNDVQLALLHHRCTLIDTSVASRSETLFNRPIRTNLPSHHPTLQNQQVTNEGIQQRRDRMVNYHNQGAGPELTPLHAGQGVRILDKETPQWHPGDVISTWTCAEPRSYIVQTPKGTRLRRTRSHLRESLHDNLWQGVIKDAAEIPHRVTFQEDITTNPMTQDVTTNGDGDAPRKPMTSLRRSGRTIRKPSRYIDE